MKAYPKGNIDENAQRRLDNELQLLREVAGFRGVVRLLNFVEDDEFKYIVMEHCPGARCTDACAVPAAARYIHAWARACRRGGRAAGRSCRGPPSPPGSAARGASATAQIVPRAERG